MTAKILQYGFTFLLSKFCLFCFVLFLFVSFFFLPFYSLPKRSCTLSGRLCRVSSSFSENMAEEDNQSLYNENNENNRVRTLKDHMNPRRTSAPSCIVFPLMHLILILSQALFNLYLLFMT